MISRHDTAHRLLGLFVLLPRDRLVDDVLDRLCMPAPCIGKYVAMVVYGMIRRMFSPLLFP
jgi:hypothetical protein